MPGFEKLNVFSVQNDIAHRFSKAEVFTLRKHELSLTKSASSISLLYR